MTWGYFWVSDPSHIQEDRWRVNKLESGERAFMEYKANEAPNEVTLPITLSSLYGHQFYINCDKGATWPQAGFLQLQLEIHVLDDSPLSALGWTTIYTLDKNLPGDKQGQRFDSAGHGKYRLKVLLQAAVEGLVMVSAK